MFNFKFYSFLLIIVTILIMTSDTFGQCLPNGHGCAPQTSQIRCCSNNCYKEPGAIVGVCR